VTNEGVQRLALGLSWRGRRTCGTAPSRP
jgi:hypothetical protein